MPASVIMLYTTIFCCCPGLSILPIVCFSSIYLYVLEKRKIVLHTCSPFSPVPPLLAVATKYGFAPVTKESFSLSRVFLFFPVNIAHFSLPSACAKISTSKRYLQKNIALCGMPISFISLILLVPM